MEKMTLEVPTLFGDHHVVEVRRLLLEMPGIEDVYASSCFQVVEITFDPGKVNEEQIKARLQTAGYLEEYSFPTEAGAATYLQEGMTPYFRHTEAYEATRQVVSFAQNINDSGRPLWPCPGFGVIRKEEE